MSDYKEYLDAKRNYEFVISSKKKEGFIEIPEGAEIAILDDEKLSFAKPVNNGDDVLVLDFGHDVDWDTTKWESWDEFIDYGFDVVWQREQDEPFLTPETTLNEQYAEIEEVRQALKDNVNHPSHYADSAIECIDAMEAMMTPEQFIGYLRGNLFKYQWRYEKKNGIEDLKKAQWYLEKLTVKIAEKNAMF